MLVLLVDAAEVHGSHRGRVYVRQNGLPEDDNLQALLEGQGRRRWLLQGKAEVLLPGRLPG